MKTTTTKPKRVTIKRAPLNEGVTARAAKPKCRALEVGHRLCTCGHPHCGPDVTN